MTVNDKYQMLDVLQTMVLESVRAMTRGEEIKWCNINVEMVRLIAEIKKTLEAEDQEKNSGVDSECVK